MALCPFAAQMPVVNHGGQVAAHQGLVVHVQVGDNSTYGQDNNPASQVSNTFWCGIDGTLQQMVDTDLAAWTEMSGNGYYTSVETEGYPTAPLSSAQVAKLGRLYAWGHVVHGWPLQTCDHGGFGLTTHAHYPSGVPDDAWGGHACPGPLRSAQLPAIIAAARTVLASVQPVSAKLLEEDSMPFVAVCTAMVPVNGIYPHVAATSVWVIYPNGSRSWVGTEADVTALLAEYGQSAPRGLTGITLARMSVVPTSGT